MRERDRECKYETMEELEFGWKKEIIRQERESVRRKREVYFCILVYCDPCSSAYLHVTDNWLMKQWKKKSERVGDQESGRVSDREK